MKLTVVSELRFVSAPDRSVWAAGSSYDLWTRYLDEFSSVTILGREEAVDAPTHGMCRIDGDGVRLSAVPHYHGARGLVLGYRRISRVTQACVHERGALILRLGSFLALTAESRLLRSRRPYGVEVVGDPWDTFAPRVVEVPLRALVRRVLTRSQRRLCAAACGAAYVTQRALQARYPCAQGEWSVSDVSLQDGQTSGRERCTSDFANDPRPIRRPGPAKLIAVGSLAQKYKGIDVLIRALAFLKSRGQRCELTVVGDGGYRHSLEELAHDLQVDVQFTGQLAKPEVVQRLDLADIFVMPSRTEGLPRALLEAMARGLPCIASRVGGIPELLDARALCEPGSAEDLAARIAAVSNGEVSSLSLAAGNLQKAREFRAEALAPRRREFYRHVRTQTARWQSERELT